MTYHRSSLSAARRLLLILAAGSAAVGACAQTVPVQLAPVVITATRLPESSATVGTPIDVIDGSDLAREQLTSFEDALSGVAGAPEFATGQAGAATSIFLRGSNSNQTLFLVDGIRLNDANTDYANFLSGARIFPTDTIEIAQGPQSTLYGGEAVGGVVSLRQAEGTGRPTEAVEVEAGSFGTVDGMVTAQGKEGTWAYNVGASGEQTQNDRANNEFESTNLALRLDDTVTPYLNVGATVRGVIERYGDPSDEYTDNLYDYETERNWLGTLFADAKLTENLSSHLIVGGQDRQFDSVAPAPGQPTETTVTTNERGVIDWQLTAQATEHNVLTAGTTLDSEETKDNGFGDIDEHQTLFSLFAQDEWSPDSTLHLTGGLRRDDYDTFGDATTGRVTLAWLVANGMLKWRASYGTSFDAPSFLDLYGKDPSFVGNPSLRPEQSSGKDAGLDFYVPDMQTVLSATVYQSDFHNLIIDNFNVYPATTENVEKARTQGLEISVKTPLFGSVQAKIAYSYLLAKDLTDEVPLLRRPRDLLTADLWQDLGRGFSIGAGGTYVGRRADIDALTYDTIADPGYTVVRVYGAWQATRALALKLRVENALDRKYEPVNGYPQPGTGIYGGAEMKF